MNQKNLNKNITSTQLEDLPESIMQQDKVLSYKFEIVDDENLYSISFDSKLTQEKTKEMMEAVQNCLYEKIADGIQMYLKQNNIEYSGFVFSKKPLEHNKIMELSECLLHAGTCGNFDNCFGNADIFYAIADYQKWVSEDCCHGCCYVAKRIHSKINGLYQYHIIGQTFNYNKVTGDEAGYFAIRRNRDSGFLDNIALASGEPVLPSFGCIDLVSLLLNIDGIQTEEQAVQFAVK